MRKRKIFSLLLATCLVPVFGQSVEEQKVSLHLEGATVKSFFEVLREQTNLNFVYNNEQTKDLPPITIQVKDCRVTEVLDQVFAQTAFSYDIDDNTVTLFQQSGEQGRRKVVKGAVTDVHGAPLPGVNVSASGRGG